jgi:uridine kinase
MNIDNHTPVSATDMRLIRRIVRDKESRNCPAAETINMWKSVRSGEFRWIYPHQEGADFVYNSSLSYELSVFRTIALPALKEVTDVSNLLGFSALPQWNSSKP